MITKNSFTKNWIKKLRQKHKKIDPTICEKMIYALYLLEQLIKWKIDFVFRGGTSLILLVKEPQRFSIDIDINTTFNEDQLITIFDKITDNSCFIKYKKDERETRVIPKAHFKFYYDSVINERESFVLLDVIYDNHCYPELIDKKVKTKWIHTEKPYIEVTIPSVESILGGKLTAFAPTTTGIKYDTGKSKEIIKQLFDIDRLFDLSKNMSVISTSFNNAVKKQNEFLLTNYDSEGVCDDIPNTSLTVAKLPPKEKNNSKDLVEIHNGLKRFVTYPIGKKYRSDDAILSAAKAAYLSLKIKQKRLGRIKKYQSIHSLNRYKFPKNYGYLSKLLKRKPSAYYYWSLSFSML